MTVAAKGKVRIVSSPKDWKALVSSPQGGIYRDLYRRCLNVQSKAKKNLERPPRRIDTGRLRSDIHVQIITIGGKLIGRIGFSVFYGLFVHEGTGIYGAKGAVITPKRAKMMRWRAKKGGWRYAKSVKGMKPNPFLTDAVNAAKG